MKKIALLQKFSNFLYGIAQLMVFSIIVGTILMFIISKQGNAIFFGMNFKPDENTIATVFKAVFWLAHILIYWSIKKFKELIDEFIQEKKFTNLVINKLKNIGKYMIEAGVIMFVSQVGFSIFSTEKTVLVLGFFIHFISILIGLFFLVLSELFKTSKELKQENDLTI